MTDYGVTPEGFRKKTAEVLLAERNGEQKATISQGLDLSPESKMGRANAVGCRQLAAGWEALEHSYHGFDPERSSDFLLTALCKLTKTRKDDATKSTVTATVNLDSGTELVNGLSFAHVAGKPSVRFTPQSDYTAGSDGLVELVFEAEVAGPIVAEAGTLTVIATSVDGWNSVTNAEDADLGEVADTNATLRLKRESQLAKAGNGTARAVVADLFDLGPWIQSVDVFENEGNATDSEGRPPHSFEVLIYDLNGPADADDLIAQIIWRHKPSGIKLYGDADDSGIATNERGEPVTVPFSRVVDVPIYIEMTLTLVAGFSPPPSFESVVKAYVATQANEDYAEAGKDVVALTVRKLPINLAGVLDVPEDDFKIGTAPSPAGSGNVEIGPRQIARFDTSRIEVTV